MPILLTLPFPPIYWCPNPCSRSSIYLVQNFFFLAKRQSPWKQLGLYLMHLIKYWDTALTLFDIWGTTHLCIRIKELIGPFLESRFWEWKGRGGKIAFWGWGWYRACCSLQWTSKSVLPRLITWILITKNTDFLNLSKFWDLRFTLLKISPRLSGLNAYHAKAEIPWLKSPTNWTSNFPQTMDSQPRSQTFRWVVRSLHQSLNSRMNDMKGSAANSQGIAYGWIQI